ncbi:toll/interleukin-1 receptor (TIR) domain-containing protein [Artemisia annua]|uniref:Toll/interleukin-1 receptor (TIR) domain-containing protein n=1 Tax=Artemisia annua TaxID=35608 RepID=A0A2U1NY50_ARTAN|nr:toll/interleukin-1 receptor (TIR) domain-containing protein [Artemisia annua]
MPAECPKLRSLSLAHSRLRNLHLGVTPNLEKLRVRDCAHLVELHMPVECPNLEKLSLRKCTDMVELHMPAECPKLVKLKLSDLQLRTLDLGITPNLDTLEVNNCTDMVELRMPAECAKLETLHLNDNAKLRTLDLGLTPNLESLYLKNCCDLEEINAPAECLKKLLDLNISHCGRFKSFKFDKKLDSTEVISSSELHLIAEADDTDDADDTGICDPDNTWPEFQFSCCYKEDPASSFGNLERLISLGFGARINVDSFSDIICGLQCLRKLTLIGCIPEAPKNLDQLDCLEQLSLRSTDIKSLPDSICMLKHLKSLELESCLLLEKLPVDIGRLECLESLILSKCTLLQGFPNSIYKLKYLRSLEIKSCCLLEKLPENIGKLECLERLFIMRCALLRDIPSSICEMKRLKHLHLFSCIQFEKLPEELGRLKCLKELNIQGTWISHLPQSIFGLKGLRIVGDRWFLESCGLTPKTRRISYDHDETFCHI